MRTPLALLLVALAMPCARADDAPHAPAAGKVAPAAGRDAPELKAERMFPQAAPSHADAIAEGRQPASPQAAPDPNLPITLTLGELQALVSARVAQVRAEGAAEQARCTAALSQGAIHHLQEQLVAPKQTK